MDDKCYLVEIVYKDADNMHRLKYLRLWASSPKAAKKKVENNYLKEINMLDRTIMIKVGRITSIFHGAAK